MQYQITRKLSILGRGDPKKQNLSIREQSRSIGGDQGDIRFFGYTVIEDRTELLSPELITSLILTDDEVNDIADMILKASFSSVGLDCLI